METDWIQVTAAKDMPKICISKLIGFACHFAISWIGKRIVCKGLVPALGSVECQ